MCGFAGIVTWDERYRVDRETLRRMSAAVAHRGPDGEGEYFNHHGPITPDRPQVALAFRRLAILDPDPRSNQPFHLYDDAGRPRLTLVFNGEIYNFRELRKELTTLRPDYEWRTTGDTEVLLVAYDVWRDKCVEHLNGMFAFAVWDEQEKSLFLARDRMGQKPLYYFAGSGNAGVVFGSELGSLRQVSWFNCAVDRQALTDYLDWGYVPSPRVIYHVSRKVRPGSLVMLKGGYEPHTRTPPYFNPNRLPVSRSATCDAIAHTREAVLAAVRQQLVSDVPLGCFLSGGMDSSLIAAAMTAATTEPVVTFSIGFSDTRYDESQYAEAVARHLGTQHHQFVVHPRAAEDLPVLATVYGEPFGDSSALPTHYLSRETSGHVKVALSGDGGDELFGGYDRYRALMIAQRFLRLPKSVRGALAVGATQLPAAHPKSSLARIKRLAVTLELPPAERYASYVRLFDGRTVTELFPDADSGRDVDYIESRYRRLLLDGYDEVTAALAVDRWTYLPEDLLTKVDRASMLHALEVRSPFMDHELVQFAAGLTTDQLLKGGPKRMLREAFKDDLPAWVFKRRKMGFAVPIGEWFRGELRPMLRDHLFAADAFARDHFNMNVVQRLVDEHEQHRIDHSQRLYALLMLELWWRNQK